MRPKTRTTVTDNDLRILAALASGPKTNRDLQASAGMHRRSIFTSLRRLKAAGLVTERALLRDARMTAWSLAVMPDAVPQIYAAPKRFA